MKRELWDGDFHVYMVDFKCGAVRGAVREDDEGFMSIYINEQCSPERKKKALLHELRHIQENDLSNDRPIREVEQCHGQRNST